MATFNNGESLSSVRTKINDAIDKVDGNAAFSNDISVSGNITVTGTVDGRDVAADGTTLDAVSTTYLPFSGGTLTGDLSFGDNDKAIFGAGSDLQIYSDGTDGYVHDIGTGILRLKSNGTKILLETAGGEALAEFINNGNAVLYSNNVERLRTNGTGVDVTGTVTADQLTVYNGTSDPDVLFRNNGTGDVTLTFRRGAADDVYTDWSLVNDSGTFKFISDNSSDPDHTQLTMSQGDISFYEDTGTTAKFFWDASAESLGIGTTTVNYPLDVRKSSTTDYVSSSTSQATPYVNGDSVISLTNATSTTNRGAFLSLGSTDAWGVTNLKYLGIVSETGTYGGNFVIGGRTASTAYSEHFRIDPTGNVGIGTSDIDAKLHVERSVYGGYNALQLENSNGNTGVLNYTDLNMLAGGSTGKVTLRMENSSASGVTDGELAIHTTSSGTTAERMRIDSSGYVGIASTAPQSKLEINHGSSSFYSSAGDEFSRSARAGNNLLLNTAGWQNATVISGESGVGAATRSTTGLILNSFYGASSYSAASMNLNSNTGSGTIQFYTGTSSAAPTERMRIDTSGNVLVGTTSTNLAYSTVNTGSAQYADGSHANSRDGGIAGYYNRLTSNGNIIVFNRSGTTVGSISVTGSATAYNTSSDRRLKENIDDADDAGSLIDAIQVRKFDWKVDGLHQRYGMIAQELNNVAPEAVLIPEDEEEMQSVDYSKLVPMLIKEIQSLRSRLAKLEAN